MRRWLLIGTLAATTAGCADVKELFTAHADAAAVAGGHQLKVERLSDLLSKGKGIQLNRETADFVANVWIDYALFAQAVASREVLSDSTTAAAAMWPQIAELRTTHWHDTLLARRSTLGPGAADSVYEANNVRVLQHILIGLRPTATPEERTAARQKAEQTLARLQRGADFGQVAQEVSADPGSARDAGFLPPSPRGAFVPAFDSAGWALAPGGTTSLVETPYGYHIIRRPPLDAVRERIVSWTQEQAGRQFDSVYVDSLGKANDLTIDTEAPKLMRKAMDDPDGGAKSGKSVADFKGGKVTVGEFLRWMRALPMPYQGQLKTADDEQLKNFARVLGTNVLLLRQADSAQVQVTPVEWTALQQQFQAQIDTLTAEMGLNTADFADSTVKGSERERIAQIKVDEYFDRLLGGAARFRPLPATLGAVLRDRLDARVYPAGLARALELARATQADSTKTPGATSAPGAVRPAPGPAPVPQAPTDTGKATR